MAKNKGEKAPKVIPRTPTGKFVKGTSGNPSGRPVGSKNQITILRQSLELLLREQAAPEMAEVLEKAVEMAKDGHPGMIKLLLEMHMSKSVADEKQAKEKVEINISSAQGPEIKPITVIESTSYEEIEDAEQ